MVTLESMSDKEIDALRAAAAAAVEPTSVRAVADLAELPFKTLHDFLNRRGLLRIDQAIRLNNAVGKPLIIKRR